MNKKIISLLLTAAMISAIPAAFAKEGDTAPLQTAPITADEAAPVIKTNFVKFQATVESFADGVISAKDANGEEVNFTLSKDTLVFGEDAEKEDDFDFEKGDVIEVYVDADSPAPLILPAQYTAALIVEQGEYLNDLDRYTKSENGYVNDANTLELAISDETKDIKYVDTNNKPVESLDGKFALVFYTVSTRSIPAQTVPEKIVVLDDSIKINLGEGKEEEPTDTQAPVVNEAQYSRHLITVEKIEDDVIYGKDENGESLNFSQLDDTLYFDADGNETEIKAEDKVWVFSNISNPQPKIFPLQLMADVVVKYDGVKGIDVDTYVKSNSFGVVVNQVGMLALNIDESTVIVDDDGEKKEVKDLENKNLAVFHTQVTFSIPGQTTPSKIVILSDAEQPEASYTDVPFGSKYYDACEELKEEGIMNGYEDGIFKPEDKLTRAELAAIVYRARHEVDEDDDEDIFDDVVGHWAKKYINKLSKNHVINGKGDGKFDPDANVSYQEAVKMIVSLVSTDEEAAAKGGYPQGYMTIAEEHSMFENIDEFKNNDDITRGDAALMVYNLLD